MYVGFVAHVIADMYFLEDQLIQILGLCIEGARGYALGCAFFFPGMFSFCFFFRGAPYRQYMSVLLML